MLDLDLDATLDKLAKYVKQVSLVAEAAKHIEYSIDLSVNAQSTHSALAECMESASRVVAIVGDAIYHEINLSAAEEAEKILPSDPEDASVYSIFDPTVIQKMLGDMNVNMDEEEGDDDED